MVNDNVAVINRPKRWDAPFEPGMTDKVIEKLLAWPHFSQIDASRFPRHLPLREILKNDTRIVRYSRGDIVIRKGDYGNSAFLVLKGMLRVVVSPDLPPELLGRQAQKKKSVFKNLGMLWKRSSFAPEVRDTSAYVTSKSRNDMIVRKDRIHGDPQVHINLPDVFRVLADYNTQVLEQHAVVGELSALTRAPRHATVVAQTDSTLLEIRWQGLRDIGKYAENWRKFIEDRYRKNVSKMVLETSPIFADLDRPTLALIGNQVVFEAFGNMDWALIGKSDQSDRSDELVISEQGDYSDGLLVISSGFARVSTTLGYGQRTLAYLKAGDCYGLDELYSSWKDGQACQLETRLTALGYLDAIRVPTHLLETHVFPKMRTPKKRLSDASNKPLADSPLLEWVGSERFINGTQAMLIDLEKCVRCDDCVTACASTHGGNPRFIRHGKTFDHWMVTNACMHCFDAPCLGGCPTGAVHRTLEGGEVIINDNTCIGCGVCANSCPYHNIRLVAIRDLSGRQVLDPDQNTPILKATKCDLCFDQAGGPACVRACPHDALKRVDFSKAIH